MSDRRDATGHRDWPWDRPHSHEEDVLEADLRIDRWTLDAIRGLGATLVEIRDAINALDVNQQAQAESVARIETTQRTISRHLAAIRHIEGDEIVANAEAQAVLADVKALVTQEGVEAQATAERVIAAIAAAGDASPKVVELQAQVDGLIAGNLDDITAADLLGLKDGLVTVDGLLKAIAPAPVVEPPVEPPVA